MNCRIEIKGLAEGEHNFTFDIDGSFFEAFESDIISDANLEVNALISKGKGTMNLDLDIQGDVIVRCDRCLADLKIPIDVEVPFSVIFTDYADSQESGDDEVMVLDSSQTYIDIAQIVYDYVNVNIPIRKVHPEGQCDPVMMEKMKDILK